MYSSSGKYSMMPDNLDKEILFADCVLLPIKYLELVPTNSVDKFFL